VSWASFLSIFSFHNAIPFST